MGAHSESIQKLQKRLAKSHKKTNVSLRDLEDVITDEDGRDKRRAAWREESHEATRRRMRRPSA